jgi:hypothetical protein
MGYWYWRNLKKDWVQDESATNRFDLPERGAVSGLKVIVQQKNATYLCNGYNDPYPVHRISPRILGNGNYEVVNLRGRQLEAMNFWETGEMSRRLLWTVTGQTITEELFIPFGRWLGDTKYGLWLEKFGAGVQFEDTNTWDTSYVTDTYQKYTIYALMRKDPEPNLFSGGFLRKRQIVNKDTASETQYAVKIPTENKLKQLYVFTEPDLSSSTYLPVTTPFTNINALWLSIKSKEEYIWDNVSSAVVAYTMHQMYSRKAETEGLSGGGQSSATFNDSKIYERQGTAYGGFNTDFVDCVENANTNLERIIKTHTYDAAGSAVTHQYYWKAWGICPHGIIPLLMQDPMSDEADWLDAKANKDVYVEATEGASTGNWYIVTDELEKTYPT